LPSACMRVFPVAEPTASFAAPFTLSIVPAICGSLYAVAIGQPAADAERSGETQSGNCKSEGTAIPTIWQLY
jgi:hypothetical protein